MYQKLPVINQIIVSDNISNSRRNLSWQNFLKLLCLLNSLLIMHARYRFMIGQHSYVSEITRDKLDYCIRQYFKFKKKLKLAKFFKITLFVEFTTHYACQIQIMNPISATDLSNRLCMQRAWQERACHQGEVVRDDWGRVSISNNYLGGQPPVRHMHVHT